MRREELVAVNGKDVKCTEGVSGEKDLLEDLKVDRKIILKCISKGNRVEDNVDCIHLFAQCSDQYRAVLNMVMYLRIP